MEFTSCTSLSSIQLCIAGLSQCLTESEDDVSFIYPCNCIFYNLIICTIPLNVRLVAIGISTDCNMIPYISHANTQVAMH